jgi:Na+-transporting NADH:ubiquinone oxidoreductase subunit NqrB
MGRVLVYFGRFALIFVGYVAASLAASAFLHVVSLGALGFTGEEASRIVAGSVVFSIPFVALFVAYFAFLPSLPAILLSESFGLRDWLHYAIGGAAIALVIVAFFIQASDASNDAVRAPRFWGAMTGGGMVGGMAYWLVAGRYAGNWRARARRRVGESA